MLQGLRAILAVMLICSANAPDPLLAQSVYFDPNTPEAQQTLDYFGAKDHVHRNVFKFFVPALNDVEDRANQERILSSSDTVTPDFTGLQGASSGGLNPGDIPDWTIAMCRKQGLSKCPVFWPAGELPSISQCTVFVNGGALFTCRHCVEDWMFAAAEANSTPEKPLTAGDIVPPFALFRGNELVFDSASVEGKIRIISWNNSPHIKPFQGNPFRHANVGEYFERSDEMFVASDIAIFGIPLDTLGELAGQMRRSQDHPDEGIGSLLAGYPVAQGSDSPFGYVKGNELKMSLGKVDGTYNLQGGRLGYIGMWSSSNRSSPGASGSPVYTADKEILGVSCFGDGSSSIGVFAEWNWHRQAWESIEKAD